MPLDDVEDKKFERSLDLTSQIRNLKASDPEFKEICAALSSGYYNDTHDISAIYRFSQDLSGGYGSKADNEKGAELEKAVRAASEISRVPQQIDRMLDDRYFNSPAAFETISIEDSSKALEDLNKRAAANQAELQKPENANNAKLHEQAERIAILQNKCYENLGSQTRVPVPKARDIVGPGHRYDHSKTSIGGWDRRAMGDIDGTKEGYKRQKHRAEFNDAEERYKQGLAVPERFQEALKKGIGYQGLGGHPEPEQPNANAKSSGRLAIKEKGEVSDSAAASAKKESKPKSENPLEKLMGKIGAMEKDQGITAKSKKESGAKEQWLHARKEDKSMKAKKPAKDNVSKGFMAGAKEGMANASTSVLKSLGNFFGGTKTPAAIKDSPSQPKQGQSSKTSK